MGIRLIIFDLDGTLADTQEDLAGSVNATRAFRGLPPLSIPDIRSAIGDGARALVARTVGGAGLEESLAFFLAHYRQHCMDRSRLYPGVTEVLEGTRDRIRSVLTNKPERISRRMLQAFKVDHHFADVVGGDSLKVKKPDPAGALRLLGDLPRSQAVLVGDSPVDVATARAAGIRAVAVAGGYADPEALRASAPDLLLPSIRDLTAHLG